MTVVGVDNPLSSRLPLCQELLHPLLVEDHAAHPVRVLVPEGPHPRHHRLVVRRVLQLPDLEHELRPGGVSLFVLALGLDLK